MTDHQREVLQALKSELWFLEMRGYEPSVREAHKELPIFRDSPSCLNYALPDERTFVRGVLADGFCAGGKMGRRNPLSTHSAERLAVTRLPRWPSAATTWARKRR